MKDSDVITIQVKEKFFEAWNEPSLQEVFAKKGAEQAKSHL
jgi:hypothetical protein